MRPGMLARMGVGSASVGGVAIVGTPQESHQAGGSSFAATAPAGIILGELLVAVTACDTPHNGPGGWTRQRNADASNLELNVWTKVATESEPSTYTFNGGIGTWWEVVIFRVAGVNLTTPINVIGSSLAGSGTSHALPGVTTTVNGCLLVGVLGVNSSAARTWGPPGSMNEIFDVQEIVDWVSVTAAVETFVTAGATGTRTFTLSDSGGASAGVLLAIAPA